MTDYNPDPQNVALEYLFRPDWSQPIVIESSWSTDIAVNQSGEETRRGLVDRPSRSMAVQHKGISSQGYDAALLESFVQAQSEGYPLVPLWSDFVKLSGAVSAGATSLPVETTASRRFFVGQTAMLVEPMTPDPTLGETRTRYRFVSVTIASVGSTAIGVSPLPSGFGRGARVFPALRSNMNLSVSARLLTRGMADTSVRYLERVGSDSGAAPGLWSVGSNPPGEQTFAGLPIFTFREDWATPPAAETIRQGEMGLVGLDSLANVYGVAPRRRWSPSVAALTRDEAWRLLRFFDSRGGRLWPFWYPNPQTGISVESFGSSSVLCRVGFPTLAQAQKWSGRHVCFVLKSGSVTIRRVSSVSDDAGRARLNLSASIDLSAVNSASVRRVTWCSLVRFDRDVMGEQWLTDSVMRTELPMIELQTSGDAESVPSLPDIAPANTDEPPLPPWLPDGNCFTASGVSVPMYQNPCGSCDPLRPVFRVANLSLPTEIRLKFKLGEWSKDSAHSHAGALDNLVASLCTSWTLPYEASYSWSSTTSRHWHHLKSDGAGAWTLTAPTVTRYVWRITKDYEAQDGSTKQVELRFVAEYEGTPSSGAWGTLFHVYVFSNEINPSYVDGTAFGGITFSRDDPAVWDGSSKRFHPQLAACASIPTTMESPCGFARYVPGGYSLDPNYTSADADNDHCSARTSNVPWIVGTPGHEADNTVFGEPAVGYRAMTLNPECDASSAMEWLAIENTSTGTGDTALKPINNGWDETNNTGLTFGHPPSIEISVCDPGQSPGSCCDGHASTPNKGTASCWKPSPTGAVQLCASRTSRVKLTLRTVAAEEAQCFDPDGNASELGGAQRFVQFQQRVLYLPVWECDYQEGGTQTLRAMRWALREPDPKATVYSATESFADNLLTNWSVAFGSWTASSGAAVATAVSGSDLNALLFYTAYTSFQDVRVSARVGSGSLPFGLVVRASSSGSGTTAGYYFEIDPSGFGAARIYRITAGSKTIVSAHVGTAGAPLTLASGDVVIVEAIRSRLALRKNHALIFELTAEDCSYTSGSVGLATEGLAAGQTWDDVEITDLSVPVGVAYAELSENGWTISVDASMMPGYDGSYDQSIANPNCGSGEVDCCKYNRDFAPKSIYESQSSSTVMQPGCSGGRPATMAETQGVIGDFVACRLELVENDPCGTPGDLGCVEVWSNSAVTKVAFP